LSGFLSRGRGWTHPAKREKKTYRSNTHHSRKEKKKKKKQKHQFSYDTQL